jgi:hypothetical protein
LGPRRARKEELEKVSDQVSKISKTESSCLKTIYKDLQSRFKQIQHLQMFWFLLVLIKIRGQGGFIKLYEKNKNRFYFKLFYFNKNMQGDRCMMHDVTMMHKIKQTI